MSHVKMRLFSSLLYVQFPKFFFVRLMKLGYSIEKSMGIQAETKG